MCNVLCQVVRLDIVVFISSSREFCRCEDSDLVVLGPRPARIGRGRSARTHLPHTRIRAIASLRTGAQARPGACRDLRFARSVALRHRADIKYMENEIDDLYRKSREEQGLPASPDDTTAAAAVAAVATRARRAEAARAGTGSTREAS